MPGVKSIIVVLLLAWLPAHAQESWQVVSGDIYDVAAIDADTYFAICDYGRIMSGTGGGRSRSFRDVPVRSRLSGVAFRDRRHGVAVGDRGVILRTYDAGDTWVRVGDTRAASLYDVTAISSTEYVAVGAGRILRSEDNGATWSVVPSPSEIALLQVRFTDIT